MFTCKDTSFILDADMSGYRIGAVLSYIQDREEKFVAYHSRAIYKQS